MRPPEADWVTEQFLGAGVEVEAPILNVGSSTEEFRRRKKPHIHDRMVAPLEAAGYRFVHFDMKAADGVDIVGDISDPSCREHLRGTGCGSIVCSNLLEHVNEPAQVAAWCVDLLPCGGDVFVTVPQSYPYHPDPIDTLFRPSPEAIAAVFPRATMVSGVTIEDGTLRDEIGGSATDLLRYLVEAVLRILAFPIRPRVARAQAHRLLWFWRPYTVSAVHLRIAPRIAGRLGDGRT